MAQQRGPDLRGGAAAAWEGVLRACKGSAILLDAVASEACRWGLGVEALLAAGATTVRRLEDATQEPANEHTAHTRLVVVLGAPFFEEAPRVEALLRGQPSLEACTIVSLLSNELLRGLRLQAGRSRVISDLLSGFASQCEEWVLATAARDPTAPWEGVTVLHAPATAGCVGTRAFLVPTPRPVAVLPGGPGQVRAVADWELGARLHEFLTGAGVASDVYSVGARGAAVAKAVAELAAAGRKGSTEEGAAKRHRASLLIVDRSLDLVGPCLHTDNVAGWIFSRLPRWGSPGSCDVQVDMEAVVLEDGQRRSSAGLPKGGVAHPGSAAAALLMDTILSSRSKESLLAVRKALLGTLSKARLGQKALSAKMGKVTSKQLFTMCKPLQGQGSTIIDNASLCQLVAATAAACAKGPAQTSHARLQSIESMILMQLEDAAFVVEQLQEVLRQAAAAGPGGADAFSRGDVRALVVLVVSALGERCTDELLQAIAEGCGTLCASDAELGQFRAHLDAVRRARGQLSEPIPLVSSQQPAVYTSLVQQLVGAILHPSTPELEDVEAHGQEVDESVLRSGFGMLGGMMGLSVKPRPGDKPNLIVFVVGGVSCVELQQIQEVAGKMRPDVTVFVGATTITSARHALDDLGAAVP